MASGLGRTDSVPTDLVGAPVIGKLYPSMQTKIERGEAAEKARIDAARAQMKPDQYAHLASIMMNLEIESRNPGTKCSFALKHMDLLRRTINPIIYDTESARKISQDNSESGVVEAASSAFAEKVVCFGPRCAKRFNVEATNKKCGRCKQAMYCSEACQKAHWNSGHKAECIAPAEAPKVASAAAGVLAATSSAEPTKSEDLAAQDAKDPASPVGAGEVSARARKRKAQAAKAKAQPLTTTPTASASAPSTPDDPWLD